MIQQQVYIITNIAMLLDGILVIVAGYVAHYLNYQLSGGEGGISTELFVASVLVVMFVNNYTLGNFGLYSDKRSASRVGLAWDIFRANLVDFSLLSVLIFILKEYGYSRNFFILFGVINFLLLLTGRFVLNLYLSQVSKSTTNSRKILIVGDLERGQFVADLMEKQLSWGHEIIGRVSLEPHLPNGNAVKTLGHINDLPDILKKHTVDEVIFAVGHDHQVNLGEYIDICKQTGIPARILPSLWAPGNPTLLVESCQGVPFLIIKTDNFHATGLLYKRVMDIIGGLIGTLIFVVLYPFIGLAIKLDSPGPILFTQTRMGQNGRKFTIYKFRTMAKDAEQTKQGLAKENEMSGAIFKIKNDPRITKIGAWLRKTSLDEIPQFLNVLLGEMSLVGTRPPTLEEVEHYQAWHLRRISIKPGITGLWQISGRNQIKDFDEIVRLDCKYLDKWRLMEDFRIILKTVIVVLQRKGAI